MTIQHRSRSDKFFIISYSIMGVLLLIGLVVFYGFSNRDFVLIELQIFAWIGIGVLDFALYVRYDMRHVYKQWKDKTEEEKLFENKRKMKASKTAFLLWVAILAVMFIDYSKIAGENVFFLARIDLTMILVSAYAIIVYK